MNINDASGSLQSVYLEWDCFLANPRHIRRGNEITWKSYLNKEFTAAVTASYVSNLAEAGQYSFQVTTDGSIFQIHYSYDKTGRILKAAALSFFLSGKYYLEESDQFVVEEDLVPSPDLPVGWMRIDYDDREQADGGAVHAKCHMHLGLLPQTRLMVNRVPNPKQFVEFIIATCYPAIYRERRLNERGRYIDLGKMCGVNKPETPELDFLDLCDYTAHLHVPAATVPPMAVPLRKS